MSDYQINQLTRTYKSLAGMGLPQELIFEAGKLKILDEMLPKLKEEGHRVLIFSQFTMTLDILEEYLTLRGKTYLRSVSCFSFSPNNGINFVIMPEQIGWQYSSNGKAGFNKSVYGRREHIHIFIIYKSWRFGDQFNNCGYCYNS